MPVAFLGSSNMPEFTGVSHVELTVRDVDRSATWYEHSWNAAAL